MSTISVVIATYNRGGMARQAVEAALAQSRVPEEIVISDDASTDGTPAILQALQAGDARIRVFRQETNLGGARNANFAIAQTRSGYIAWCSDDDRFLPGHLEASVAYLDAHPEAGVVHSGFTDAVETTDGEMHIERRLRFPTPRAIDRGNMFRYLARYYDWPFHPSTLVLRREIWQRVGEFDPAYALSDTDWFVRAAEQCRIVMLPRRGVLNRRHPGNWSNRLGSARMQKEIFEIVERAIRRRWPGPCLARSWWRMLWRANVRLRLLWTLRMRLLSGHAEAACAAWRGVLHDTGRTAPPIFETAGVRLIQWWCAGQPERAQDARQSVSPL